MESNSTSAQTSIGNHDRKRQRLSSRSDPTNTSESIINSEFTCLSASEQNQNSTSNCAEISTGAVFDSLGSRTSRDDEGYCKDGIHSRCLEKSNTAASLTNKTSTSPVSHADETFYSTVTSRSMANYPSYTQSSPSFAYSKDNLLTHLRSPQLSPASSVSISAINFGDPYLTDKPPPSSAHRANASREIPRVSKQLSAPCSDNSEEPPYISLPRPLIADSDSEYPMLSGQHNQGQNSLDFQTSSEPTIGRELAKLFVMQDMVECSPVITAKIVKSQLRPTLILTNARLDDNVMNVLRFDETGQETKIEIRPGSDFSYPLAKSRLISVSININRFEKRSDPKAGSRIMSEATPYCSEMDESSQRNAQLRLSNSIDLGSMESIFEDESHPSMHSSIRGRKEGLSLYGILNQTKTSQGRYLLKQWLLRPSLDLNIIHSRQQSVECFVRTESQSTIGQLANCLSHIKNIPKVLQSLPRKATISEWQAILQIYNHSQEFLVGDSPLIQKILQQFIVKDLVEIGAFINDVLDFDESVIEGRCVVKINVDEELDRMRHTYHGLDSFLSEIAKEISLTIPSNFTSTINVIYFPQLGYLITVPKNPDWKTDQDFCLEGLSYQFSTESTVYYKNEAMRDREIDILQGLQERILEYSHTLIACSDICAELDVLVSLAQVARLRNYKRPTLTEENVLHIVNGRHPLQELVVDSFVSNDTHLGEPEGSHSSAKADETNSSFVPADSAVIGLTDKILTRLQTRETVSSIQSAFMTDLQQVIVTLNMATKRSLIILDEFGKGTTSTDGAGIFCGVIEHLVNRIHDRPRVLATTHFHELFENQLLDLTLPISLYTMEIYHEQNSLEASFLFRVIPGTSPSSLGPACAAMAEMPMSIVQRVPMLTEHEKSMQKMYEQLTGMLLSLDLDQMLEEESTTVESKGICGETLDQQTDCTTSSECHQKPESSSTNVMMVNIDTVNNTANTQNGNFSDGDHDCDDESSHNGNTRDRAISQLMKHAAKIAQKEQEASSEQEEDV
ncbi:MutS protein msh5 [Haplosporangium sp. Z 27]|nr:MutS protein msh5 [Haplosporangium sp. Z 27]